MKALLIVLVVFYNETAQFRITPMPTFKGCEEAAARVNDKAIRPSLPLRTEIRAYCVENK